MDTDPNVTRLRLVIKYVIKIAKCWRSLYHAEVEKRKVLERQVEDMRRGIIGAYKAMHGEK